MRRRRQHGIGGLWDATWRNDQGQVVIFQMPNWWLWGWLGLTMLSLVFSGATADVFFWLADTSLLIWCYFEIFKGENYFRRALGGVVLIYVIITIIKAIK